VKAPEHQAVEWAILADDPAFADWEALEAWLAADRRHAVLFDRACLRVEEAASALDRCDNSRSLRLVDPVISSAEATMAASMRRYWPAAGIAAALAGIAVISQLSLKQPAAPGNRIIATHAGELRSVKLPDRSEVVLNGDTALVVNGREVRLERGQAEFAVVHDEAHPFSVRIGSIVIRDVGTRFDVRVDQLGTRVSVLEGEVEVQASGGTFRLGAGDRTLLDRGGSPVPSVAGSPGGATGWQSGQLTFEDNSYAEVFEDVRRRTGIAIRLESGLANRRFAGTLSLGGSEAIIIANLQTTLGLSARREAGGWIMEVPRGR
jgi:transmembrane sensor